MRGQAVEATSLAGRSGPQHKAPSVELPPRPGCGAPLPAAPQGHGLLPHFCLAAILEGPEVTGAARPLCSARCGSGVGSRAGQVGWRVTRPLLLCRGLIHLLTHMAEALHQARLLAFLVIPPAVAPG